MLGFPEVDRTRIRLVGGKGANLGELSRIEGIRVPDGFCVSTEAFERAMAEAPSTGELLDRLALLKMENRDEIRGLGAEIRRVIEGIAIPEDVQEAITRLCRAVQRDCGGFAGGFLRRPAGYVPERCR